MVGAVQWYAENDDEYRHAGMDLYLDPSVHGLGLGTDAVRTMARHLVHDHHYHRLVIDPAVDNLAAIRCYTKVGFRPVGTMRQYERGADGTWHGQQVQQGVDRLEQLLRRRPVGEAPRGARTPRAAGRRSGSLMKCS